MNRTSARRARPSHKVLYLLHLSADAQLSVSPVRAPLAGVIGDVAPLALSLIEQDTRPPYLSEADFDILHELAERSELLPGLTWYPLPPSAHALFVKVLATGRGRWEDAEGAPLSAAEPLTAKLFWQLQADGTQALRFDLSAAAGQGNWVHLPLVPPWVIDPPSGVCRPVRAAAGSDELVGELLGYGRVGADQVAGVRERIRSCASPLPEPQRVEVETLPPGKPQIDVRLRNIEVGSSGRFLRLPSVCLGFCYGDLRLAWDAEGHSRLLSDDERQPRRVLSVAREHAFEEACLARLEGLGLVPLATLAGLDYPPGDGGLLVPGERERLTEAWANAQRGLAALEAEGWRIQRDPDLVGELLLARAWTCRLGD
ncbi:MAG: hypothetical protein ACOCVP_06680, partial [Wenzhouxiangella sp.]